MTEPGRVCVIGAQGALGRAVAEQFASAGWTVHPAGRRRDKREGFRQLDLDRPETVRAAIRDVDLVVSTVPHPGLKAERLVVEQGAVLVNCSHAPSSAAAALTREVGEPQGTVLLNGGLTPGTANLIAAELLRRHPQADCLEVAFTVLNAGTSGKAGGLYAHEGLTGRSHHRVATLPLPAPFGELACIEIAEDDDLGYDEVAAGRRVEAYLAFADRTLNWGLRTLNALRLMRVMPKAAFAANRGEQDEASREPAVVWVGARCRSELLGEMTIECEGEYRATAASARVFGEALVRGDRRGCFNPEDIFRLDDLSGSLERAGLRIGDLNS